MKLEITLQPIGPYFLGGERIFEGSDNKHYFIRSLPYPAQTTLFGILRYLGIPDPQRDMRVTHEDQDNIGTDSFDLLRTEEPQKFGRIKGISPLYLKDECGNYYIKTPMDHQISKANIRNQTYSPFEQYVEDALQQYLLPEDFNVKDGMTDSWMNVESGAIVEDLFLSEEREVISKKKLEKAFAKREWKHLKKGFSFVFFADVAEDFVYTKEKRLIKSGFIASVRPKEDTDEPIEQIEKLDYGKEGPQRLYALSDIYLTAEGVKKLYKRCAFVCSDTRGFRGRTTKYSEETIQKKLPRYECTTTLIRAGSIFIPRVGAIEECISILKNPHAEIAGMNRIIVLEGGEH